MATFSLQGNRLQWQDTNNGYYGYRIYRSLAPFDADTLPPVYVTLPGGSTEYLDTDVTTGTSYYYMVSAFSDDKEILAPNTEIVVTNYIPNNIGDNVFGGYYIGNIEIPSGTYAIIMAGLDGQSPTTLTWKNTNTDTPNTDSEFDGLANTLAMIAGNSDVTPIEIHEAANYCVNYNGAGYEDWYMPSKDELNLAWTNRDELSPLDMSNGYYWTSSQVNAGTSWVQHFGNGIHYSNNLGTKNRTYPVRPVRRIKIA